MSTYSNADTRVAMTEYWSCHSEKTNLVGMILDDNAAEIAKYEQPEIMSFLPPFVDMNIVELGAGIGRFTGLFAEKADRVLAVDFMESYVEQNKFNNSNFTNIDYKCADVTTLQLTDNSYDLVFTNWLLMYLDDQEVHALIQKTLSWLREDGYLFVRESCFKPSGNASGTSVEVPTKYRDPEFYNDIFKQIEMVTKELKSFKYDVILSKPLNSYIQIKQNQYQIVWLLQKRRTS